MSLEEEILLHQFGQGVRSLADMLEQFRALESGEQRSRFVSLYCELSDYVLSKTDTDQALADFSPDDARAMYDYLRLYRFTTGKSGIVFIPASSSPPNDRLDLAYQVLLTFFKLEYQRRSASEKGTTTAWRYQDLSDPSVVQDILFKHKQLVEQVYADPSYHSEFVCLAKSWQDDESRRQTPDPELNDLPQTHFNFMTYDELVTTTIAPFADKSMRGLILLRQSLNNALAKQYDLSQDQANRLVIDVIEKHLKEI